MMKMPCFVTFLAINKLNYTQQSRVGRFPKRFVVLSLESAAFHFPSFLYYMFEYFLVSGGNIITAASSSESAAVQFQKLHISG